MSPHLARDEESPLVDQGTSLGATTNSPPPTTTTTTPNSDAESAKCAEAGVSNFEVGNANQDDASTSNVAPNNWNIEGGRELG